MNRIFTFFLLAFCGLATLNAQNFEFQYHGQSVDGGEVVIPAVEDEFGFGELWCETNPGSNPANGLVLKQLGSTSASGTATLTIEYNSLDASTVQWCMGGACNIMKTNSLTKSFMVNGSVLVQFDATDIKSKGYLLAKLSANVGGEKHSVTIKFTNEDVSGLSSLQMQNRDNNIRSIIYDLQGRRVVDVNGTDIRLTNLPAGIYLMDGRKVIIR